MWLTTYNSVHRLSVVGNRLSKLKGNVVSLNDVAFLAGLILYCLIRLVQSESCTPYLNRVSLGKDLHVRDFQHKPKFGVYVESPLRSSL